MTRSDTELVTAARSGDTAALGDIYDRYADRIYSFCVSRLRNPADAADCTQDTFVRAATRLGQLRSPDRLRPWLFAIARNTIIDASRHRGRTAPSDELGDMTSDAAGPEAVAGRTAAAELIWSAASALQARDQDLLRLQLQEGLGGEDLAAVMGVSRSHLDVMQTRLKERIAKAAGSLLVARHGRDDCVELQALLANWDGSFTLDIRSTVTRHVESCDVCERRRGVLTAAGNYLGAVPLIGAPVMLRARTAAAMEQAESSPVQHARRRRRRSDRDQSGWRWRDDGFPTARDLRPRLQMFAMILAACAAVAIVGGAAALAGQLRDDVVVQVTGAAPTATPDPTVTPVPTATPTPEPTVTPAPTTTPTPEPTVEPVPTEPPVVAPPPPPATATPTPPPPTATPTPTPPPSPPTIVRAAVSPGTINTSTGRCSITTAVASVVVEDVVAITGATATWTAPGEGGRSTTMTTGGNNIYTATVGPFLEPGTVVISMTVVNEQGGSAVGTATLTVQPCIG